MFGNNYRSHYPSQYIRKGDRIYVRIEQGRQTVLEFSVENVDDYTSLIGEIRYAGSKLKGLANVFIRNHSRGWSETRPLMFYQGMPAPRRSMLRGKVRSEGLRRNMSLSCSGMLAPWETH
ncbi:MAG: hypothetical protein K2M31_08090 [Muribaculaceae bacterium]|nr:hypothetical protein [Muribaculaceae bacterium]